MSIIYLYSSTATERSNSITLIITVTIMDIITSMDTTMDIIMGITTSTVITMDIIMATITDTITSMGIIMDITMAMDTIMDIIMVIITAACMVMVLEDLATEAFKITRSSFNLAIFTSISVMPKTCSYWYSHCIALQKDTNKHKVKR
ncbi:hypothetical protein AVEN_247620-1 [Araneus ventricosus]|uniref:Uncharacterized protein n=1 Tax=Araneus ventricosus TaxID=182803 RepID=A0A4Y2QS82_ARAVE|nr:hypothetical protein AVEN_247620-1 [Araneus ventricosus]